MLVTAMNSLDLKDSKEGYMGGFGERKGKIM